MTKKNLNRISTLCSGVTGLLALAVLASLVACAGAASTDSVAPEDVPPVVAQQDDTVIAEGVVEPARWVELSFDRTTTAIDVLVQEGDTLSQGDPLILFDPLDAQLAVRQAEAAVALAQAQLIRAKLGPRPEPIALAEAGVIVAGTVISHTSALRDEITSGQMRSDIAAVQAALAAATAEQRQAQNLHDRTLKCFTFTLGGQERKICPALGRPEEFSRFAMLAADAGLAAAELQLNATQNSAFAQLRAADASIESAIAQRDAALARLDQAILGPTPEQIASAQAAVAQAEAALATAQAALDDLELRAPFDATVLDLAIGAGETATPGRPLLLLATLDELVVRTIDLVELDVARVSEGQMATVSVDALPDVEFQGRVTRIDLQSLDYRGDVTYPVTIDLDQPAADLRWGMTTLVEIQVEEG